MSKSIPGSCIFIHDTPNEIKTKIRAAYCPPKQAQGNPVLELTEYAVFTERKTMEIPRPPKYGGPEIFESYEKMEKAYVEGKLHPLDLKNGVAEALIEILKPARDHFQKRPQMLEKMMKIGVTR